MPAWSQHMHILTNSHSCTYIQTFSNTFNHSQIYSIFINMFSSCQIYSIFCEIYIIVEKYILHACTAGLTCLIQFRIPSTKTKDRSTTHPWSLSISQLHTKWTIWRGILNWQGGREGLIWEGWGNGNVGGNGTNGFGHPGPRGHVANGGQDTIRWVWCTIHVCGGLREWWVVVWVSGEVWIWY